MYEDKAARKQRQAERAVHRSAPEHSDNSPVHGS